MKHLVDFLKACIEQKITLSEKEVMDMIEKSEQEKELCEIAFPLIKDQNNFMRLLEKATRMENRDEKISLLVKYIATTNKTDDELFDIVKKSNKNQSAYQHIYPALKVKSRTLKELLVLMERAEYQWHFVDKIIPLLNLSKQKESFIWNMVKNSRFDYQICRHTIELLSPAHAWEIISKRNVSPYICRLGILRLKKQEDIYQTIIKSEFDKETCEIGIPKLSEKKQVQLIIKESKCNKNACDVVIPGLKQASNIKLMFNILQKDPYAYMYCEALITQCKDEKSLMELIKPHINHLEIRKKALASPALTSEDGILFVLTEGYFQEELISLAVKKLNLKKKSEPQLLALMDKVGYEYEFCRKVVPFLKLTKKKDEEILALLKQNGNYDEDLCAATIHYFSNEETMLALLERNKHRKSFERMFKNVAKQLKAETIEALFMGCYNEEALVAMVPYIHKRDVLIAKLKNDNYREKLCKKVTELLSIP